ncbi:MAG: hypothetical protein WC943_13695 [Elusimicrobiota bacterium]|jgi:HEAT repeat protein
MNPTAAPPLPQQTFHTERLLIDILRHGRSPAERATAAAVLKVFVHQSDGTRAALIACLDGLQEREDLVRAAAAKSLSLAGGDNASRSALERIAARFDESLGLRALCLKAMYGMVDVQGSLLIDILRRPSEPLVLRQAAAWALFKASHRIDTRDALLEALKETLEPPLRFEALRSLFGAAETIQGREAFLRLAQDTAELSELRVLAVLGLIAANRDPEIARLLERLSSRDPDARVRIAAGQAMSGAVDESVAESFHLDQVGPGLWRDPLLHE